MECWAGRRATFYVQRACTTHLDLTAGQFGCEVWVNHLTAKALLDSGSMVTMVHAKVIGRLGPVGKTLRVVCSHGDISEYPPGACDHFLWLYLSDTRSWGGKKSDT